MCHRFLCECPPWTENMNVTYSITLVTDVNANVNVTVN